MHRPSLRLSRHVSMGLACVLALSHAAMAFKVMINLNQLPAQLMRNFSSWEIGVTGSDGVMGTGPAHPTDPMTEEQRDTLLSYYAKKPKVLNTLWSFLAGDRKASVNLTNFDAFINQRWPSAFNMAGAAGGPAPNMFVWDTWTAKKEPDSMLTVDQLDVLQKANFRKVLILVRGWGNRSDAAIAERKASILHPQTLGVVIEGNPSAFTLSSPRLPMNPRLAVAQFTKATGKPLYILLPPGNQVGGPAAWHKPWIGRIKGMLGNFTVALGADYMCNGPLTFIASAYGLGSNEADWLPGMRPNGDAADTFGGSVIYLNRQKYSRCQSPPPAASA